MQTGCSLFSICLIISRYCRFAGSVSALADPDIKIYAAIKHTIRNEMFSYLPPFRASLLSLGLEYSVYEKIALSAKNTGEYDFIVIDAENSFDENLTRLF